MERYQSYKDSGIEWLGSVPESWEISHVKRICRKVTDGAHTSPDTSSEDYPFITVVNLKNSKLDFKNCLFTSDFDYQRLVRNGCNPKLGDVLYSKDGTISESVAICEEKDFVVGSSFIILRPLLKRCNSRYLSYLISSAVMRYQAIVYIKGASLPRISIFNVAKLLCIVPSVNEQKAIAHYLDTKTAQIDRKIDLFTQKATLYGNLKQSLINETVTRGLDKSVPMKDSGVEWIGEVPVNWSIKHFKQFSTMKGRIGWQGLKHSEFINEGPFLITGMNFRGGKIDWSQVYHVTNDRYEQAPEVQLRENDILMTKDRTIGKLLFVDNIPTPRKASLNSHLLVFRPIKQSYHPRYLYYQLDSSTFHRYTEIAKTGTTFFGISQAAVGRYIAVLPPLAEQKAIAQYLDTKTAKIDQAIQTIHTQIAKLKELRKTLINDVVTGKIKVSDSQ